MSMDQDSSWPTIIPGEEIPKATLVYFRGRARNRAHAAIIDEFLKSKITQKELATRLGRDTATISRWLAGPTNLEMDTLSDLLFAISGGEASYEVAHAVAASEDDLQGPEWLRDSDATTRTSRAAGSNT